MRTSAHAKRYSLFYVFNPMQEPVLDDADGGDDEAPCDTDGACDGRKHLGEEGHEAERAEVDRVDDLREGEEHPEDRKGHVRLQDRHEGWVVLLGGRLLRRGRGRRGGDTLLGSGSGASSLLRSCTFSPSVGSDSSADFSGEAPRVVRPL